MNTTKPGPWEKLHLGEAMMMLGHAGKVLKWDEKELETHTQYMNNQMGIKPGTQPEDSEMMVLGDHTTNIIQQTPEPKPKSKFPSLLKLAAGAALTATGAGAGVGLSMGIPALVELLKPAPVVSEPVADTPRAPEAEKWIGIELDK